MQSIHSRMPAGHFHGSIRSRFCLEGVTLVETHYSAGTELPLHAHDRPYMCLVVNGAFEERSCGVVSEHGDSDLIFHPAGEAHSDRFTRVGGICFNIEFGSSEIWDPVLLHGNRLGNARLYRDDRVSRVGKQLYREFRQVEDAGSEVSRFLLKGLVMTMVGELLRRRETDGQAAPEYLSRVRDVLHGRYLTGITLGDVAEVADVHPTHMTRVFRQHFGCTIGEYLRNLRIEYARNQLVRTRTPISRIALDAGFADHSHFSRTFRRSTGYTPSEYRELIGEH